MAFQIQNFARVSKSANEEIVNVQDSVKVDSSKTPLLTDVAGCFREYNYFSKTWTGGVAGGAAATAAGDSHNVISMPGYFDAVAYDLQVGDLIKAYSYVDRLLLTYRVDYIADPGVSKRVNLIIVSSGVVSIALTAAQILALNATAVTLVPAFSNYFVTLGSVVANGFNDPNVTTSTVYTGGANITLQYSDGTNVTGIAASSLAAALLTGAGAQNALALSPTNSMTNGIAKAIQLTTATAFAAGNKLLKVTALCDFFPIM